jgi:transcriptional regulator with XRE-family HTH domain
VQQARDHDPERLLALRVQPDARAQVVRVVVAEAARVAMVLVPVESPVALLLSAETMEEVLVRRPFEGVGVEEPERDADHVKDLRRLRGARGATGGRAFTESSQACYTGAMARFRRPDSRRAEGGRLIRLREALGLSQRELAQEFHVAPAAVALWERGNRTLPGPALRLLRLYESAVGIEPEGAAPPGWLETSPLSRGLELTASALELGAHWAWLGLRGMLAAEGERDAIRARVQQAAARRLVQRLGKMKGLSMKLAQMLSYVDPRYFAQPRRWSRCCRPRRHRWRRRW